jgi:cation diffusion facilitator family transporter
MEKRDSLVAAWVSIISNVFLTGIKVVVGILFNSQVLIADGVHNAGDVIASIASLSSMRISNKPADEDHPYGHGKAENIAAFIVGVIMALAGIGIAYESVEVLLSPAPKAHMITFSVAFLSLIWKQALYVYTIRIGRKINSKGLIATAYDHLADVYASIAAVVGIGASLVGKYYHTPYTAYGDPIAGIIVAFFVMKLSFEMGREAVEVLMEKNVDPEKIDQYAELVKAVPQVKRIDRLRAREHGHYILVDVRVGVPGNITVQEGHDISRQIKGTIMDSDKNVHEVLVHLNPWYQEEEEKVK